MQIICIITKSCYTRNANHLHLQIISYIYLLMIIDALLAAGLVALASLVGVLFFGHDSKLIGAERYVVPVAVGVFLSLVLYELIPETLLQAPQWGGIAVAAGFIGFYVLANVLHKHYHQKEEADCDRKGAAMLLLIGDAVHNMADGVILGGAFLIDPAVGIATAIGLALHEIPQEIVEFGVLLRAGHTRMRALMYNFISASSIFVGTLLIVLVAEHGEEYIWILTGIAAGNLLFLAASDLLPRVHGNLKNYGSIWNSALSILVGFTVMTIVITWTHEEFGHGHDHGHEAHAEDVHEEHEDRDLHTEDMHNEDDHATS